MHRSTALLVLACAFPDRTELAGLTLGERDALLLEVRRQRSVIVSPRMSRVRPAASRPSSRSRAPRCERATTPPARWELEHDGVRLTLRALDSRDAAAAVAAGADMDAARAVLLERAVVAAERDGRPVGVHELAGEVAEAVSASLANHDPTAELLLDVACSACETSWQSVLDVAAFVWTEPAAQAERLLQDVHLLARAYGWSEEQTLALGNSRRTAYLAMAGA